MEKRPPFCTGKPGNLFFLYLISRYIPVEIVGAASHAFERIQVPQPGNLVEHSWLAFDQAKSPKKNPKKKEIKYLGTVVFRDRWCSSLQRAVVGGGIRGLSRRFGPISD